MRMNDEDGVEEDESQSDEGMEGGVGVKKVST